MKKLLVIAVIAVVGLASCKKDYTCSCTILGQTTVSEFKDVTQSDAEEACDEADAAAQLLGGSCTLD